MLYGGKDGVDQLYAMDSEWLGHRCGIVDELFVLKDKRCAIIYSVYMDSGAGSYYLPLSE